MHYTSFVVAALASFAQALDVQVVSVGKNTATNTTGLKFWPEKITAEVGTMVQFQFWAGNHTVTQSNFDDPCIPISNINSSIKGIYSGFQPVAASSAMGMVPVFTIEIKDKKPLWLYCSKAKHCEGGMSLVINENTQANSSRSLENYRMLAQSATASELVPGGGSSGGSGGDKGGNNGDNGGSNGGNTETASPTIIETASPTTIETAIQTGGNASATGTASPSATESTVTAAAPKLFIPSTLLLVVGATFVFL
ncbi:hypothetical protein G7046_g4948 [Stylonectria norvegica]|nr:hypothetical protein G7046_g4948 [Stylonectria norvegica]